MKKALLTLALLLILVIANSQNTYIFHENCEPPSFNDSLTGSPQWTIQDSIPYPNAPANHYIRATIQPGFYYYLYFPPIIPDTSYQYYYLTFNHICKIDFLDLAVIQFHTCPPDTVPWRSIPLSSYLGSGIYMGKFACNTYGTLWQPAMVHAIPTVNWWRQEVFNITPLIINNGLNVPFLVRFVMGDAGSVGSNGNYGWLIDNINVIGTDAPMGINNIEDPDIRIYTQSKSICIYNTDYQEVYIYDLLGRIIHHGNLQNDLNSFQVNNNGLFIVRLINGNKTYLKKVNITF